MTESPNGGAHGESNGVKSETIASIIQDVPSLPELCARIHKTVEAFLNIEVSSEKVRSVQRQCRESLGIFEGALSSYSLDELSLSYNGGKDCLVLLILYLAALHAHYSNPHSYHSANDTRSNASSPAQLPPTLNSVYIISKLPFKAVDDFVETTISQYHLRLASYAKPMKEAFTDYLHDHPQVRAIFVGTRRTDPHGSVLKHFDRTDRGWPDFMRIHPVIDWHYAEIWTFIRALGVPYCNLYDAGYTSLGGRKDSFPNPALKYDIDGEGRYRPAYELLDDDEERLGRDAKSGEPVLTDVKTIV